MRQNEQKRSPRSSPFTCFGHAGPWSGIDAVLANRVARHSLCDVGLVGATGMFLLLYVLFQSAECELTATTIARVRKIDLHFRDPKPEAEDRIADRVAAHILTQQNTAWTNAVHLRDIQRLWEPHLHEIAQWVPGKPKKKRILVVGRSD